MKYFDASSLKKLKLIARQFHFIEKVIFLLLIVALFIGATGVLGIINLGLSTSVPERGGSITEGIVGTPNLINPLLAASDVDRDLVALIFSGLLRPDGAGEFVPDMAQSFEISEDGLSYIFVLKDNLFWHDGERVTSEDIAFTVQTSKIPTLKSPLRAGWEGVSVEIINERTIQFWLKRPYAPFLENTTIGILPKHIWGNATAEQFTFSEFNRRPIGSGPYKAVSFEKNDLGVIQSYKLKAFKKYALGEPFIKNFILKFYPSETQLISAYRNGEIDLLSAISPQNIDSLKEEGGRLKTLALPRVFAAFFNQNNNPALAKKEVRIALSRATDRNKIIREVLAGYGIVLNHPIPPGSFGALTQDESNDETFSLEEANEILSKNGWKMNEDKGVLEKKQKKKATLGLAFALTTSDAPELVRTAELLQDMWSKIGAKLEIKIFETGDLNQNVIRSRDYDIILFGEIVGRDPDPFAFWHSSQRNDPGLNIAMYANITADSLLEEARTISDEQERKEKYIEFQKEVAKDSPAVFLYSPYYLYIVPEELKGFDTENITVPSERFTTVHRWYLETRNVWKIFAPLSPTANVNPATQ